MAERHYVKKSKTKQNLSGNKYTAREVTVVKWNKNRTQDMWPSCHLSIVILRSPRISWGFGFHTEFFIDINNYHCHWRNNGNRIGMGNFNIVPIHSSRKKYLSIDSTTLAHMLAFLEIGPKKSIRWSICPSKSSLRTKAGTGSTTASSGTWKEKTLFIMNLKRME